MNVIVFIIALKWMNYCRSSFKYFQEKCEGKNREKKKEQILIEKNQRTSR